MERTVTVRTELESILVEQALAMARELEAVTDAAPDGQVLAVGELAAVQLGRELTRVALESALQRQAQAAYATVADSETFAARWGPLAQALGIEPAGSLTVLGDGAEWIWNAAATQFPAATQVLDVFHACEHLASAGRVLFGDEAADWVERGRRSLLADGWPGLLDHIGTTPVEGRTTAGQAGLDDLIGYFAKHTNRLGYYGRLRTGRSIGSGGVESLARRMGRRLKVPGRGWCVDHLEGMASLIATADTPEWESLWTRAAA